MTARVTVLVEHEDGTVERWRAELVELGYDDNLSTLAVHGQAWHRDHPSGLTKLSAITEATR